MSLTLCPLTIPSLAMYILPERWTTMTPVTIHDLLHPDSPAVVRALTVKCGMCGVPVGEFCHAVGVGKKMAGLVHLARATQHYKEAKGEK